jgi:hypothetical protein
VPRPSSVNRMIVARQTCFCGLLRLVTTAFRRARSAALASTMIFPHAPDSHPPRAGGILFRILPSGFIH